MHMRNMFLALVMLVALCSTALAEGAFTVTGNVPKSIELTAPDNPGKWALSFGENRHDVGNIHLQTNSNLWSIYISATPDKMTSGTHSIANSMIAFSLYRDSYFVFDKGFIELSSTPQEMLECAIADDSSIKDAQIPLELRQFIVGGDYPADNYQITVTITGTVS